jgi:hypothetical protein
MNSSANPSASGLSHTESPLIPNVKTMATKKTAVAIVLGLVIAVSWLGFIDTQSAAYIDGALKQALVAYGVARGVNAVVSVLQTIHLFGLGIGEVLDPINDLVERFSSVMELAIGSLLIQKILLEITSSLFFKVALSVSGGILILSLYVRTGINTLLISRTFITLVFIRFCISIVVMLNGMVAATFVTDKIDADVAAVEMVEKSAPAPEPTTEDLATDLASQAEPAQQGMPAEGAAMPQVTEPEKKNWLGKLTDMGSKIKDLSAKAVVVVKEKLKKWDPKAMKEKIEKVVPQILNLMALFLLKTLILPLVFLYGLKYALEQVWNIKPIPLYTGKPRLSL